MVALRDRPHKRAEANLTIWQQALKWGLRHAVAHSGVAYDQYPSTRQFDRIA